MMDKKLRRAARSCALMMVLACAASLRAETSLVWPQFRGPGGDGISQNASPPVSFGPQEGLTWRTELPGKAWSSPVVADGMVWLTTAIEQFPTEAERLEMLRKSNIEERKFKQLAIAKAIELRLIAVDLATGDISKSIELTTVTEPDAIHSLNSYASPTPVLDEANIYCHFGTYGTFCLTRSQGEMVWQRQLPLQHSVGPGSSPFRHGDKLVLIQDGVERQYVTALDCQTGVTLWESDRPPMDAPSGDQKKAYCTPVAATDSGGREQLLCLGSQWMVSYEPTTGNELWRVYHGKGFSVVPRPVVHGDRVYFSTGFGKPELWAVGIDGTGDVTDTHVDWTVTKSIPAKPSPLLHDGLLYVVEDNGVASCFDPEDGSKVWTRRLGGKFSASPVLAGEYLYFSNHDGEIFVMRPGHEAEVLHTNELGEQIMASPAAFEQTLLVRTVDALYRFDSP